MIAGLPLSTWLTLAAAVVPGLLLVLAFRAAQGGDRGGGSGHGGDRDRDRGN